MECKMGISNTGGLALLTSLFSASKKVRRD